MIQSSAMSGLNSVLSSVTGPRRLRSVLRRTTAPIHCLLESLDGPTELRVSIPASVFGGDIFGVMSQHLREALICPPSQETTTASSARRNRVLRSADKPVSTNPVFTNPSDFFPSLAHTSKHSTLRAEPNKPGSSNVLPLQQKADAQTFGAFSEPGVEGNSREFRWAETSVAGASAAGDFTAIGNGKSTDKHITPPAPALISSLGRYWESMSKRRETDQAQQPNHADVSASPESLARPAKFAVSGSDQRTAPPAWSTFGASDVAEKLRAFSAGSHASPKPARLNTTHDRQVQNVFNIEVKNANQYSPDYDDLGDRIAQILQEQALQHGIDIT